jgi:hypothetical protein
MRLRNLNRYFIVVVMQMVDKNDHDVLQAEDESNEKWVQLWKEAVLLN